MAGGPGKLPAAIREETQRLDKWLWYARVVKSRTLAATLITQGKIRVNGEKADKPSYTIKPGDIITSTVQRHVRVLRVGAAGTRRGPAAEAMTLYEDLSPPQAPSQPEAVGTAPRDEGSGRPTKRERRLIDRLRGRA